MNKARNSLPLEAQRQQAQAGLTLLESLVALAILGLGAALLWYGLGAAKRMQTIALQKSVALNLAQSEIESLRGRPEGRISDSSYAPNLPNAFRFNIVREVRNRADSTEVWSAPALGVPAHSRDIPPPVEVRISVFNIVSHPFGGDTQGEKPLISLSLFLPRYQWH